MINSAQFKLGFPYCSKVLWQKLFFWGRKRFVCFPCQRHKSVKGMPDDLFEGLPHQIYEVFCIFGAAVPSFIGIPCTQTFVAAARKTRRAVREEKQFSAYDTLLAVRRASDSESGRNTLRPFPGSKGRTKFTECFLFRQDGWKSYYKILFPIRIFISSFWHFP